MSQPSISILAEPLLGPGAKRLVLSCDHGATFGAFLPGRKALPELVFLDVLMDRHDRENGCQCSREVRPRWTEPARA